MKSIFKLSILAVIMLFVSCSENQEIFNDVSTEATRDFKGCETAFAYCEKNSTCFADTEPSFNRWGWVIGPVEEGYIGKCEVYAGAGKCRIESGTMVGWIDYYYENGEVRVVYTAADGYGFTEIHLYVGTDMYPELPNGKPTVAPGHYGYGGNYPDGIDQVEYIIDEDFDGAPVYIIAHAVSCSGK